MGSTLPPQPCTGHGGTNPLPWVLQGDKPWTPSQLRAVTAHPSLLPIEDPHPTKTIPVPGAGHSIPHTSTLLGSVGHSSSAPAVPGPGGVWGGAVKSLQCQGSQVPAGAFGSLTCATGVRHPPEPRVLGIPPKRLLLSLHRWGSWGSLQKNLPKDGKVSFQPPPVPGSTGRHTGAPEDADLQAPRSGTPRLC